MKKNHKRFGRWLVPTFAILAIAGLLVGVNIWQPNADQTPNIAQQVVAPLTVKQVFAAAAVQAQKRAQLKPGQVYYQKLLRYGYSGFCHPYKSYMETYTDQDGTLLKKVFRNSQNKIRESVGFGTYESRYFDQSAIDPAETNNQNACPQPVFPSPSDETAYMKHRETIALAYGFHGTDQKPASAGGLLYLQDLTSGNVQKQIDTFKKLKDLNEWKVTQNVSMPKYFNEKVIELSYEAGPHIFEKIYFSQATKTFMGISQLYYYSSPFPLTDVVVESGVRASTEL